MMRHRTQCHLCNLKIYAHITRHFARIHMNKRMYTRTHAMLAGGVGAGHGR